MVTFLENAYHLHILIYFKQICILCYSDPEAFNETFYFFKKKAKLLLRKEQWYLNVLLLC